MQDYMKALQKQFDRQEFDDLRALVSALQLHFCSIVDSVCPYTHFMFSRQLAQ